MILVSRINRRQLPGVCSLLIETGRYANELGRGCPYKRDPVGVRDHAVCNFDHFAHRYSCYLTTDAVGREFSPERSANIEN